jgi:excinuclease UvrABC nuclease subunit
MSEVQTITWSGKSGQIYKFWIYPIGTTFEEKPGNYIFAKESKPHTWSPVYIGQTKNLNSRLENHEKEQCAKRNGATHVHCHINNTESSRLSEERDLILKFQPTCNEQLVE